MEFFNKREDVIDLELTPYGEYLLAQGDFKPELYAFFDDEILYDSKFAGVDTETQNSIKDRIKEVPRLKTQYMFTNTELPSIKELDELIDAAPAGSGIPHYYVLEKLGKLNLQPADYIKQYALPWPLGNSSFESDKAPAWDINLLYNDFSSSAGYVPVTFFTSSMHPHLKIPQLDVTIEYKTKGYPSTGTPETSEDNTKKVNNLRLKEFDELHENPPLYEDGYYDFQEDFVVLEINEHNVPFLKENFDIEVFEVWEDPKYVKYDEELVQKYFTRKSSIVNDKGLLKSQEEIIKSNEDDLELRLLPLNQTYVNHFFNIYVDHEIDKDLMCQLNPNVKQKGYFISDPLDCVKDDEVNILSSDIYKEAVETTPECDF
jgi:hypothetical protein